MISALSSIVTKAQFITGFLIIAAIFLLAYLVTRYTKFGGGSDYGTGGEDHTEGWDSSDFDFD